MYGSMGFELFKANDGLTDWNKLTRNPNNPPPPNNNTANQNQIITLPLVDLEEEEVITKTPCEHLNDLIAIPGVQAEIQDLKVKNNGANEHGFFVKNNSQSTDGSALPLTSYFTETIPNDPTDPHHLSINGPTGLKTGKISWLIHCHTNTSISGGVQMFSGGDVEDLYLVAQKHNTGNQVKDYSQYGVVVVTNSGIYAVKFDNKTSFDNFNSKFDIFKKDLNRKLGYTGESTSPNRLINLFLKQLKESKLNGVSLYKATESTTNTVTTITSWNKLSLNSNNNSNSAIPTPTPFN